MNSTVVEMFIRVVPVNLFRMGTKNSPQLHKVRTMPPRTLEQSFDIQIYNKGGVDFVSANTGGISTFDREKVGLVGFWWCIPKGTPIPAGLRISRDFNPRPANQPTHYTIRPVHDMPLTDYIELLEKLAQSTELVSGNTDTMARSAR